MTPLERHQEEFRRTKVSYRWADFVRLLTRLGFEQLPNRRTTGSARAFYHRGINRILREHEPHEGDGRMYREQIKRVQDWLKDKGLL